MSHHDDDTTRTLGFDSFSFSPDASPDAGDAGDAGPVFGERRPLDELLEEILPLLMLNGHRLAADLTESLGGIDDEELALDLESGELPLEPAESDTKATFAAWSEALNERFTEEQCRDLHSLLLRFEAVLDRRSLRREASGERPAIVHSSAHRH